MKGVGWVLDIYVGNSGANIWIKLENGKTIHLTDSYEPSFYIEPNGDVDPHGLVETILLHPSVTKAIVEEKYTSILNRERDNVIHVFTADASSFRGMREDIEKLNVVKSWFNTDIYHFQRYLFTKSFAPTNKVEVEWDQKWRLANAKVIDDFEETAPPPFSTLLFEAKMQSGKLTSSARRDPVKKLILKTEDNGAETLEGCEANVLSDFSSRVLEIDPDFLVTNNCEETLNYVLERADALCLGLQLGRVQTRGFSPRSLESVVRGRALADLSDFKEYGIAGITELSRFTLAPPTSSAKWPAGKTIDARQSFEAMRKDILVPKRRAYPRFAMTAGEINQKDKGGLLFAPIPGLHENAAELDFESMFPNIILHHNISYETVTPACIDKTRQGFLGEVVKAVLERRLHFKHLRNKLPKDCLEHGWCDQRQKALKSVLVCIYGFSGCFANRFNNVAVFNEINAIARRVLIQTSNLCLANGFKVLYINTDAIYVKRRDATPEDYESLARLIEVETGLPIAVDHHFRFLVFMKQRTHREMEAMNRFYGKLINGELHYRGIELRRRDCPSFLKSFQERLINILFDASNESEVFKNQVKDAEAFTQFVRCKVREGEADPKELGISKHLWRNLEDYRAMLPHVVAAKHLARRGKRLEEHSSVDFVYMNATHSNPMRRVIPSPIKDEQNGYYDRERYAELVLDVAKTILKPFEAERTKPLVLDFFCTKN